METKKVIAALAVGAGLLGAGIVGGFALDQPEDVVQFVNVTKEVPFLVEKEVVKEVEVIKEVEVAGDAVLVEDEEFLKKVCDRLMYDDIQECKEEVEAEDVALKLALDKLSDEYEVFDLLEDKGLIKDEDEANIVKVYDDYDDVVVKESDFDDSEYRFEVKLKVEDEDRDVKKKFIFTVKVEDDEAEIVKVVEE